MTFLSHEISLVLTFPEDDQKDIVLKSKDLCDLKKITKLRELLSSVKAYKILGPTLTLSFYKIIVELLTPGYEIMPDSFQNSVVNEVSARQTISDKIIANI